MDKKFEKTLISIILTIAILISIMPATIFAADSFSTASTLTLNEALSDTLENKSDVNYYKFTTSANDSFYKIELRNTEATDTISLILYSGDDATTDIYELTANVAGVDSDTRKLEQNRTYYIAVKNPYVYVGNPIGNYKLSVTEIKDDIADNFKNSQSLTLNKKVAYNLEADGDADYFKFTTTANNSYYKMELANSEVTDTVGAVLYSEDDSTTRMLDLTADKSSLDSKIIKLEKKHTYYLLVEKAYSYNSPIGMYKLSITEIKDDAPDSFNSSIKLSLNKKGTYKLNVDNDVDYFKFKTSKKGSYTITLANKSGNDSINAIIYSDDDATQNIATIKANKALKNSTTLKLKGSYTYYIAVAESYSYDSVTGSYSLTIKKK